MKIYCEKSKHLYFLINDNIELLGYRIVQAELISEDHKLSIMIERIDGDPVNLEDCSYVNRYIATLLYA